MCVLYTGGRGESDHLTFSLSSKTLLWALLQAACAAQRGVRPFLPPRSPQSGGRQGHPQATVGQRENMQVLWRQRLEHKERLRWRQRVTGLWAWVGGGQAEKGKDTCVETRA